MSATEDKNREEDNTLREGGSQNTDIISKGNVLSLESNKNAEPFGVMSEDTPHPTLKVALEGTNANKDSEDATVDNSNENLIKTDKKQSELPELNTNSGKGSGDNAAKTKASDETDIVDDVNIELKDTMTYNTEAIAEKDESLDSFLDKCDEIELKKADDADPVDVEDDDMELRWDDDDSSNQVVGSDNGSSDPKNDILSEDQLLEEPSDVMSKETSDGNLEGTNINLDTDILKDDSEGNIIDKVKHPKEIETTNESVACPKLDIPIDNTESNSKDLLSKVTEITKESEISSKLDVSVEKSEDKNITEDELLGEPDINTEGVIICPEIETPTETNMDEDDDNVSEDKLLEEPEISKEASDLDLENEILVEKCNDKNNDEPLKDLESSELILQKEVSTEKENLDDIIEEDKLLAESENNTETATFKMASFTDVILNTDPDDIMLEETDPNVESSGIEETGVSKNKDSDDNDDVLLEDKLLEETDPDVEISGIDETEASKNKDSDENDDVLEDKLLEETETAVVIPETDISMDVDEDKEGELLKDDKPQLESGTPMDVDNAEQSVEDKTKVEVKNIDQPMNIQSEIENKVVDDPMDHQLNIEKTNTEQIIDEHTKENNESGLSVDDQSEITKKITDKPIEDPAKTVENIKNDNTIDQTKLEDQPIDQPAETETNKNKPIDDQTEIKEKNINQVISEKENLNEPITNQAITDNKNEDQLIDNSSIIEELNHSPLQIDTLTDSNIPNEQTEKPEITLPENTTLETKVENKLESEKPEKFTKNENQDTNLDKNNETDEIPPKNSSLYLEDSFVHIKTDHGLHKPDVMLEIPTQELIDMDDTDFSMNLDQSDDIDSTNDFDKYDDKDDKTVDKIASVEDTVNEQTIVTEPTVDEVQKDSDVLTTDKKCLVTVQEMIEESLEKMFADEQLAKVTEVVGATTSQIQEPDAQPSTSVTRMTPDTSDEVPEISDSLGLLAESAGRMMEDDEEPDDDDDGDDDDDFDQDESSNQISAEQSEDSNPPVLEDIEPVTEPEEKDIETPDPKEDEFEFGICSAGNTSQDKEDKMDIEEFGTVELQAETVRDEETTSAEDALLNDGDTNKQAEDAQETTEQMDIETVKLSDTSDNEVEVEPTNIEQSVAEQSKEIEEQQDKPKQSPSKSPKSSNQSSIKLLTQSPCKQSPSKMKKLEITAQEASSVVNYVDLEESSSSEDDIQEIQKETEPDTPIEKPATPDPENVTNVNIPTGIEIMCSGGSTSEIVTKEGEVVISGVPKPPPHKPARLNTSEVSIKTASNAEPLVIPETTINEQPTTQSKPKLSQEIFSLDSDDEDGAAKEKPDSPHKMTALELEKARETSKCINYSCTSDNKVPYKMADASVVAYYDAGRKRRSMVCQPCADVVANRTKNLIQGIKDLKPLLDLEMSKLSQDLVEISDSESEDEDMTPEEPKESIGEKGAKFVEDNLAKFLNDTWKKYDMDTRLKETQIMLDDEIEKLERDSKEIDAMLNECQVATDKLRCELYATFECRRQELPALVVWDTPETKLIALEADSNPPAATAVEAAESRQAKRRMSSCSETPAKRPAIPLGYAPLDADSSKENKAAIPLPDVKVADDDKDISVVKLSAEAAPADLPPPGEISRPPLRVSMPVYAMKNAFGPWLKGKVLEIQPKNPGAGSPFSLCRVKFDHKMKTNGKILPARCIAYSEPADVRMTIGTRLIALFKDSNKRESYYSGVVAEIPNPVNNYRYLVFFDDGYAQYVQHQFTRLVCESSHLVWEEVHPFSREFVREYLLAYPERPMVRLHEGQHLKTEWNGKWWSSRVTKVDASLAQVMFVGDGRREWIYRGSTRLAPLYLELRAAERHRPRPMPRSKAQPRFNMPYVEYTRSDEPESTKQPEAQTDQQQQQNDEIRRQRSVAKKSTSIPQLPPPPQPSMPNNVDAVTSRVVYYTPKNAVRPYKMTPHKCSPKCKRSDVLSLKELRTYNPLAKPLLSGWERQIVRYKGHKEVMSRAPYGRRLHGMRQIVRYKGHKEVMYRAPCGRRVRGMRELHRYLRAVDSDLPVDLFDFHHATHCLAEFVLNKCLVGKKDLSHGKENVPVPCVNYYDDSLPEFCSYNTERTPTAGVPLNLEPEFLCGCDCTDDCQDKSKCACWKMTLEGARTIGLDGPNVGYVYKRLPEPLPSGIYECNSRCKCKHTCLNRVAQHPLQLKLQVFKTLNRGWGIRALNDVPKGSFLCVYAGNLLTDATANLDGLNEGDEYLAELDYIEVVEQMKEGYEEDIPDADKKLDKKEQAKDDETEEDESSTSEEEDRASKNDKEDDDFRPGYIGLGVTEFNKRLRKRERAKKDKGNTATVDKDKEKDGKDNKDPNAEEDCITISDDEEVREPSRFMVQAGMGANEFISKYKSVRTLFGKDEACYIMDAKVQGNIGRYLNHSCTPNVFVQNVFVDTHDPRFPWVAFFALSHIKAGTELTWNYNYDVGSVPGKVLYCFCGAPNCRGRLL